MLLLQAKKRNTSSVLTFTFHCLEAGGVQAKVYGLVRQGTRGRVGDRDLISDFS